MKTIIAIAGVASLLASVSLARAELNPAEMLNYSADREKAIAALTPEVKRQCIDDVTHKRQKLKPIGDLVYNDDISREVYQLFYWNGSDRGVAFILPVKIEDGKGMVGNIACFYALNGDGLHFQLSQQVVPRF